MADSDSASLRPVDQAQQDLMRMILRGDYPPGAMLPGERQLAAQLGVTRPTLREVLRRMETAGWLCIHHGKSTMVNDYLHKGGLTVLSDIVHFSAELPLNFVPNLLQVRLDLAPSYTRLALEHAPQMVIDFLETYTGLPDTPKAYADYDWQLHRLLTIASDNPIYALILNGFTQFYAALAENHYFQAAEARQASATFYGMLLDHARAGDLDGATNITRNIMVMSIQLWEGISAE